MLFKGLYWLHRFFSGVWRWFCRRFTPAGRVVLGAFVVTGLMVPDTENNVAYQGFTLLAALFLVAVAGSFFARARFAIRRVMPRIGTAGCPLIYQVLVRNLSGRPQPDLAVLEDIADPRLSFPEWLAAQMADERRVRSFRFSDHRRPNPFKVAVLKETPVPPVGPNQEVAARAELTPLRRGPLRLAGVTVARPDPLGLFRALTRVAQPQSILILPKRYSVPPVALPGTMKYQEGGVALASSVGQSDQFVSLRDYRPGDPLRHIHWRSWARAGRPVVKEFEDEFFVRHALVLDTFTDQARSEAFEEAVSVAASFACTIRTQESLLDLLFVGPESFCFTSGRGLGRADHMLEILASVRTCRDRPFSTLERLVLDHVGVVSGCICIFLDWDEPRRRFIRKLRSLGIPALVLVVVEAEKDLAPAALADEPGQCFVLVAGKIEEGLMELSREP